MKKQILYVGLKDKDTKKQEISTRKAKNIIAKLCQDCTLSESVGVYTHRNGKQIKENSIKVELLFKSESEVKEIARNIKAILNQESIGYEVVESNSMLI
jgi:hypothetical protein